MCASGLLVLCVVWEITRQKHAVCESFACVRRFSRSRFLLPSHSSPPTNNVHTTTTTTTTSTTRTVQFPPDVTPKSETALVEQLRDDSARYRLAERLSQTRRPLQSTVCSKQKSCKLKAKRGSASLSCLAQFDQHRREVTATKETVNSRIRSSIVHVDSMVKKVFETALCVVCVQRVWFCFRI